MNRADRLKLMAATLRTSSVFRATGKDIYGQDVGWAYPVTDKEAVDLAFAMDAYIDSRIKEENIGVGK
jgi:hypothetical protein